MKKTIENPPERKYIAAILGTKATSAENYTEYHYHTFTTAE